MCTHAQAPSNAPAATEYELLEQYTTIVPDTVRVVGDACAEQYTTIVPDTVRVDGDACADLLHVMIDASYVDWRHVDTYNDIRC